MTIVNLCLLFLNALLAVGNYRVSRKHFEYERKPALSVSMVDAANRIKLVLKNKGSIPASNISLRVELALGDHKFQLGALTLVSLNPEEETQRDLTEDLFSELEKGKRIDSSLEEMPTGEHDELTNELILGEVAIYHIRRAHVEYDLKVIGRYGTDINPEPIFRLDYTFHVELNQLDDSPYEDYQYRDNFKTTITPQTGVWTRAVST